MVSKTVSRGLVAVSLMAILSGCTSSNLGESLGIGSQASAPAASAAAPVGAVVQGVCPQVSLRDGTAFYRTYGKGSKEDPENVAFQASIADTTRACTRNEAAIGITVMAQGRVASGPAGKAGTLSMPVRVEVVDRDQVLYSEVVKTEVAIADPAQPAQFVFTKNDISVPATLSSFTRVYIGFDQGPQKKK